MLNQFTREQVRC